MNKSTLIQSDFVPPGVTVAIVQRVKEARRVIAVNMDVATAAAFTVERIDRLTAGETLAHLGIDEPSIVVRVRNDSAAAARFIAEMVTEPNLDELQASIEKVVDDAWRRGGDPS